MQAMKALTALSVLFALLFLSACTPVEPPAIPYLPTVTQSDGRVVGAPARTPTPAIAAMQGAHGVTMHITNGVEGLVVEIHSETGIGKADVLLPMVGDATPITVRLHLRGLEGWRFTFGNISTAGAVSTGDGSVSQESQIGDAFGNPIDASSSYWMEVTHVEDESASGGYFELALPSAFLESEESAFEISFVDFYR